MREFYRSTPRIIALAITGYRRRRGWMAWHIGAMSRIGGEDYPALEDMTGQAVEADLPSDTMLGHKLRLWKAALGTLEGDADGG